MALIYNDVLSYEPAIYSDNTDSKKRPELKNDHVDPSVEKYRSFIKDIIQALTATNTPYTIKNIEHILEQYGVNEDASHIRNDSVSNIIHNLQKMKLYNSGEENDLDNKEKTARDVAEKLGNIRNEIRKQTLYRKSASAQFTASTSALEKEFSTNDPITTGTSYAEIWLRLAMFIGEVKKDYVDFYADLMRSILRCMSHLMKMFRKPLPRRYLQVMMVIMFRLIQVKCRQATMHFKKMSTG